MKQDSVRRLAMAAMMAALTAVVTLVVRIPSPMGGFVNLGDIPVLLGGWLLGPWWGAAAAGLGAAAADLIAGSAVFAPGTLLIKAVMAMAAGLLGTALFRKKTGAAGRLFARVLSALVAEIWMIAGYFGYTALLLGRGSAALLSVPGNLVQAGVAALGAVLLGSALDKALGGKKEG